MVVMLALPAARGDDPPKGEKKPSAKERYAALVKEFTSKRQDTLAEARKVKGEEQQKLYDKYYALGNEYADKFYALAEEDPKDPAAADALFWVVQNAQGGPLYQKAADKLTPLIAAMPLKDLAGQLNR